MNLYYFLSVKCLFVATMGFHRMVYRRHWAKVEYALGTITIRTAELASANPSKLKAVPNFNYRANTAISIAR